MEEWVRRRLIFYLLYIYLCSIYVQDCVFNVSLCIIIIFYFAAKLECMDMRMRMR